MEELIIECPYCGHKNHFDIQKQGWRNQIKEVVISLLAVKLGQHTSSYFLGQEWTEIGSLDGKLSTKIMDVFNKTAGILRYPGNGNKVVWKEPLCSSPKCNAPFDIFITIEPSNGISKIWPHLTGIVNEKGEYSSWPVYRRFEKHLAAFRLPYWGEVIFIASVLFLIPLIGLIPSLSSKQFQTKTIESMLLYIGVALLVSFMIASLKYFGNYLRKSRDFIMDLLEIKNKNSFIFWHNYMIARYAGTALVRDLSTEKSGESSISSRFTQAAIIGGIPSIIILLVVWAFIYFPSLSVIDFSIFLELFFWIIAAYFTGTTAWICLNFSVFMVENISLLPMKLSPLNNFANIEPICKIIILSLFSFLPVALLPIMLLGVGIVLPSQTQLLDSLLLPWLLIIFPFALFVLSIADKMMLIFGFSYISILLSATLVNKNILGFPSELVVLQIVFGIFWTLLLTYQLVHAFSPLHKILENSKSAFMHSLDLQIVDLTKFIKERSVKKSLDQEISTEIERVVRIREVASKAKTSILNFPTLASVLSPLFSSILFPVALDLLNRIIQNYIV